MLGYLESISRSEDTNLSEVPSGHFDGGEDINLSRCFLTTSGIF